MEILSESTVDLTSRQEVEIYSEENGEVLSDIHPDTDAVIVQVLADGVPENSIEIVSDIITDVISKSVTRSFNKIVKPFNPQEKIYSCHNCDKRFAQFKSCVDHRRICKEKSAEMFICETCKRSFCSKKSLKRHEGSYHSNTPKPHIVLECDQCAVTFSTKNKLKVHMSDKHGVGSSIPGDMKLCALEGCTFKHEKMSFVKAHMTIVHGGKEKMKCSICPFQCYSLSGMNKHLRAVHTANIEETVFEERTISIDTGSAPPSNIPTIGHNNVMNDLNLIEDFLDINEHFTTDVISVLGDAIVDGASDISFNFGDEASELDTFGLVGDVDDNNFERVLHFDEM